MEVHMRIYNTTDLKLAALLLASISSSSFTLLSQKDSDRKIIQVSYCEGQQKLFERLFMDYTNRVASVSLYEYNRKINDLRDAVRGERK